MESCEQAGRNNLCPCGSGKKYKKCCLLLKGVPTRRILPSLSITPAMTGKIRSQLEAERKRKEKFGEVRPAVHCDFRGHKVVAVGNELHWSKDWKQFPDFLLDYVKIALGREWGKTELAKPLSERHEIMKWYDGMCRFQQSQKPGPDGLYGMMPNGPMKAYMLLSYDLYILRHHSALHAALVRRLKQKKPFQGARHELFAAATCIRAGFDIEYEDETDKARKHTEFVATHRVTKQKIALEAKSRHRPGVLGFDGQRELVEAVQADIKRLFKNALAKPAEYPYVIFFDLNLPPGRLMDEAVQKDILETTIKVSTSYGERAPFSLLLFSSFPDHYIEGDLPAPVGCLLPVFGFNPEIVPTHPQAIMAIEEAARGFGVIPNTFEEAG